MASIWQELLISLTPVSSTDVRTKAVVLMLFIHCLLLILLFAAPRERGKEQKKQQHIRKTLK